jgi:signal transduction histidine kinase
MSLFGGTELQRKLWLSEATAAALEIAARCPDVDDLLRFWAKEIARSLGRTRVALFVIEGERWLRILPETQSDEVPFVTEATLSDALQKLEPTRFEPVVAGEPATLLVRYAARDGWRGLLMLWTELGFLAGQIRQAEEIAAAVGRSLTVLKKSEMSREQAFAVERSRLAAEIHDGHLQSIASAKLLSEICMTLERTRMSEQLGTELLRLNDLLTTAVREARQFVLELRSPPVTADQFLPWLRAYTDDFSRENGIHVEMRVDGDGDLPQAQAEEATRLIREALTNVRKHAQAANVRIVVRFSSRTTSISVADDGVGFDVRSKMQELLDSSHNGLIGVRYRAESVGGEMRLRSEVGRGTTLLFRLPRPERRSFADRRASPPAAARPSDGVVIPPASVSQRDTSIRDSIRATLAEALDSFLEAEESTAGRRRDSEV